MVNKLGIRPGNRVAIVAAPPGFDLALPEDVTTITRLSGHCDLVLFFTTARAELDRRLDRIGEVIAPAGSAWIAWPKQAARQRLAGAPTDMSDNAVREVALPRGLVDVKVCAIDDVWSGLKLVWRKELRGR